VFPGSGDSFSDRQMRPRRGEDQNEIKTGRGEQILLPFEHRHAPCLRKGVPPRLGWRKAADNFHATFRFQLAQRRDVRLHRHPQSDQTDTNGHISSGSSQAADLADRRDRPPSVAVGLIAERGRTASGRGVAAVHLTADLAVRLEACDAAISCCTRSAP
jgi:hypothetical protein